MRDEGGQALLTVVMALAISATVVVGLRHAQDRIIGAARLQRAGEASVEAAAASVAEAYVRDRSRASRLPFDVAVIGAATAAAGDLAARNGGAAIASLELRCTDHGLEVSLVMSGSTHRAGFAAPECSQR